MTSCRLESRLLTIPSSHPSEHRLLCIHYQHERLCPKGQTSSMARLLSGIVFKAQITELSECLIYRASFEVCRDRTAAIDVQRSSFSRSQRAVWEGHQLLEDPSCPPGGVNHRDRRNNPYWSALLSLPSQLRDGAGGGAGRPDVYE